MDANMRQPARVTAGRTLNPIRCSKRCDLTNTIREHGVRRVLAVL